MHVFTRILITVLTCLSIACEKPEEVARYVKAPLENIDLRDRTALNQAIHEAKIRVASVRDDELRSHLSSDIDDTYARSLAQIQEAERAEKARIALEEERKLRAEREKAAAEAREIERKLELARSLESKRNKPAPAEKRDRTASQSERRRAAVEAQRERTKDAVTELEVGLRNSALGDGTKVLVLRNAKPYPVNFDLRCYTRDGGTQKTFSITTPAQGEKHFGFLQGWCGNFRGGERCEALVDGERMWSYTVP